MNPLDQNTDFRTSFVTTHAPAEVFGRINNVRAWWEGEFEGSTKALGDEFTYRYGDVHYSKQRIVESVPGRRVVWLVTDGAINFVEDKSEWTGTRIVFDIALTDDGGSQVTFTHEGLSPRKECYDDCSGAWTSIVGNSLKAYIETGRGDLEVLS